MQNIVKRKLEILRSVLLREGYCHRHLICMTLKSRLTYDKEGGNTGCDHGQS